MNCEGARDGLSALVGGHFGLTEWALLAAHVTQCAECRQAEVHLRQPAAASRPLTQPRAVLAALRKAMELARIGVTASPALGVRRRALLPARIRVWPASAHEIAARTIASASQAFGLGITRSVKRTIRFRPSVQAVGVVLTLAFTLYAMQRTDGPQQPALTPAPPHPGLLPAPVEPPQVESGRLEPTRLEPAQAEPAPRAPSQKIISGAPPRTDERRQTPSGAPPRAAALSPPAVSASGPGREVASSTPTLLSELPVSAAHVVGRLSAKNASAAQRDFIALLADVGGAERGRSRGVRFTAIEVTVPQSRYNEFADGLARIGSWRLEAARFPLPDAVHIIILVSE
jgi:hypothetical protein